MERIGTRKPAATLGQGRRARQAREGSCWSLWSGPGCSYTTIMKPRKIAQTQTMLAVIDTVCRDIVASITVLRDSLGQCHAGLSDGHHTAQKNSPHRFSRRFGGTDGATVHSAAAGRGGQRGAKDAAGGVRLPATAHRGPPLAGCCAPGRSG